MIDSTPVECGRSRPTAKRSNLAGWAGYGYCASVELVRPARTNEPRRHGAPQLRRLRQIIESVNNTLKAQLSLEHHGGRSHQGVAVRILQRLLAITAAIWHNHHSHQPVLRSLTAYDH